MSRRTYDDASSARLRHVPSLSASVSSGRAVLGAAKHKNWRANYLRALNIYTPDVDPARARLAADAAVARQRGRPSEAPAAPVSAVEGPAPSARRRGLLGHRRDPTGADEGTGPRRSTSSSNSSAGSAVSRLLGRHHARGSGSSGSPPDAKSGAYVFGMRSHLFRSRLVADRVSSPIEIPPARTPSQARTPDARGRSRSRCASPTSVDGRSHAKAPFQQLEQPPAQLLSWEEPSAMMANDGWSLEVHKPLGTSGGPYDWVADPCGVGIPEEEGEDTEDDETLDLDRVEDGRDGREEDDEDDIFKMEGLGSDDSDADGPHPQHPQPLRRTRSGRYSREPNVGTGRRRGSLSMGTASASANQNEADDFRTLSASFVPPHQMVERDCFSLGLRDELKRRPLRT